MTSSARCSSRCQLRRPKKPCNCLNDVTRYATPKLGAYVVLTALGLLASLIFARPELALIAVPFAVLLAVGLAYARKPDVRVHLELDRERVLEGDEITLEVELDARDSVARLELLLGIPRGLELVTGRNPVSLRLEVGEERLLELRFRCARWGAYRLGGGPLRAPGAAGPPCLGANARPGPNACLLPLP